MAPAPLLADALEPGQRVLVVLDKQQAELDFRDLPSLVRRVAAAIARTLQDDGLARKGVFVGYDTRFLSDRFAREVAGVLAANGIREDPREIIDLTWNAVNSDEPFVRVPVGKDAVHVIEQREKLGNDAFLAWMREKMG